MKKRTISLSTRHDKLLETMSKKINISFTETIQRGLELLEEQQAKRDKEVRGEK